MRTDVSEKPAPGIFMETRTIPWFSVQVRTFVARAYFLWGVLQIPELHDDPPGRIKGLLGIQLGIFGVPIIHVGISK
jgi:hypothetical protein